MNTKNKTLKGKFIGTKDFYKVVMGIALPIMIQNGISNFVNLLDNLMIGRVGTNSLSGVAIANQLIFVYFLVIFGATAGVGIFTAQYYGMHDIVGVRYTFRMKVITNFLLTLICIIVLYSGSDLLISLFLEGEGSAADAAETLLIGKQYMNLSLIGLIPTSISNAYAGTLRETGETKVPMLSAMIAVFVNLIGNFLLIYGFFGLPALGANGAAIATVISRFVELIVLVIYTATHSAKHQFIIGAFRSFHIPLNLVGKFVLKSLPLMANETLWSVGTTFLNQCYSYRSLNAVAAINIESTIWNLLGVAFLAMGDAVGIIVGQILGSGDLDKAKDHAQKLRVFTSFCGLVFGILMVLISPFFPMLYNTSAEIRSMATSFILINGVLMPFYAYTHASYFIIRAGGRTGITMIFDSCFVWFISVPAAFIISRFTAIDVITMMAIVQSLEIIKCIIGGIMVNAGIWARKIVG